MSTSPLSPTIPPIETGRMDSKPAASPQTHRAATAIQRVFRGHHARLETSKRGFLCQRSYEKAKKELLEPSLLKKIPARGSSSIYPIHSEPTVIAKNCVGLTPQQRLQKMRAFREICDEHRLSHLIIPQARCKGTWLIEERLPLTRDQGREQIGLYLCHQQEFTPAVQEFTLLNCLFKCEDMITDEGLAAVFGVPMGRYDNYPVFISEKGGVRTYNIGLIDLEQCYPVQEKLEFGWEVVPRLKKAITLFPCHFEAIMEIGKRFSKKLTQQQCQELAETRDKVLYTFQKMYIDHETFLRAQGITPAQARELPEGLTNMSDARKKDFCDKTMQAFTNKCQRWELEQFNKDGFKEILPEVLDMVVQLLGQCFKESIDKDGDESPVMTYPRLVTMRTFVLPENAYKEMEWEVGCLLMKVAYKNPLHNQGFASNIIESILEELSRGKEIGKYPASSYKRIIQL